MSGSKVEGSSAPVLRRDPSEVLSVSRDSSDQEIKTAYRKLVLSKSMPTRKVRSRLLTWERLWSVWFIVLQVVILSLLYSSAVTILTLSIILSNT